jgi:hypothetical protein
VPVGRIPLLQYCTPFVLVLHNVSQMVQSTALPGTKSKKNIPGKHSADLND